MAGLDKILQYFGAPALVILCLLTATKLFFSLKNYYFKCLESNIDRSRLLEQLEAPNGLRVAYHAMLQRSLDWLDRWLNPTSTLKRPDLANSTFSNAALWFWSARAFGINLTIAVIYPFILLISIWVFSNVDTSGLDGVFPESLPDWRRYTIMTLLICFAFLLHQSTRSRGWYRVIWLIGAIAIAIIGADAVAGVGIIAFAFADGAVGVGLIAVAVAVAAAIVVAVLGFDVVSIGVIVVAFAIAGVGVGVGDVVVAVAGVIAIAGVSALIYFHEKAVETDRQLLYYCGFLLFTGFTVSFFFGFTRTTTNELTVFQLIFFVTIPIINTLYDYTSLGLTRYLLQKSMDTHRNLIWFALVDFIAACLFLSALSLTIVVAISGLNLIAAGHSAHPVDIGGILSRLRHTPGDLSLWWIYAMIFSTFLPTFAHATIAVGNMPLTRISKKWRGKIISGLKELEAGGDGHHTKESGSWYFALQRTWTVVITLIGFLLIGTIVYLFLPGLGRTILFLCEWLAEAIGENVSPGNISPFFGFLGF